MSTELIANPFQTGVAVAESATARQTQARESAEVLALVHAAKMNPRNPVQAAERIRNAFTRTGLAEAAEYAFARGGSNITGPSIRSAEAMRLEWGNLSTGWTEVERFVGPDGVGMSKVEAYCVDYETTNREAIQFVVRHWRDTKSGGYKLKDERDIYELCANQAQRRKRACIIAMIPGDVVEMAMAQAAVTLKTKADTSPEAMAKMLAAFEPFGVTRSMIEKRIQRSIDAIQPAQVVMLKRIYTSLRDEMSTAADWFDVAAQVESVTAHVEAKRRAKGSPPPPPPPAPDVARDADFFIRAIEETADENVAGLVLDEADELPAAERDKVAQAFAKRFPPR